MIRNMDITALRAFVTVADTGGVTKASGVLNLTQSAVSMQIKRLEDMLDIALFDRSARQLRLTAAGEQMLSFARRILDLNDEALTRLTAPSFEGELRLGVPHDIIYPAVPMILKQFAAAYPRMRVHLISSLTEQLKRLFARGELDVMLTTETGVDPGGEVLLNRGLFWLGALNGQAWRQRPIRLAFEHSGVFRPLAQRALDAAGISWEMAVETDSSRTIEASVSADLAVHVSIEGTEPEHLELIQHGGALPDLPNININLHHIDLKQDEPLAALVNMTRQAYLQF